MSEEMYPVDALVSSGYYLRAVMKTKERCLDDIFGADGAAVLR